ncbi:unnamed protein product [Spirodela intermedia]|uniref:Uncharacterized protein n=1 Tax=Spirodela intermedia TaxID=51605 RepID=A0A7I8KD68_SPIIN|nr:unnamed protein product [Spirodela intermedia]
MTFLYLKSSWRRDYLECTKIITDQTSLGLGLAHNKVWFSISATVSSATTPLLFPWQLSSTHLLYAPSCCTALLLLSATKEPKSTFKEGRPINILS